MNDREIISEFVIESREHLADIENQLLAIETAGADMDLELVNTVFRAVHSIKGAAGFLGFSTVGQLAHGLENVLNLVRSRQLIPNAGVTDVLLRSADKLRAMLDDIEHSNESQVSEHLDALQRIVKNLLAEEIRGPSPADPVSQSPPAADSYAAPACDAAEPPATAIPSPHGEVPVAHTPAEEQTADVTTSGNRATVEPARAGETPLPPAVSAESQSPPHSTAVATAAGAHGESSIRVAVTVLDRLMNLAGELVLARNQLLQTVSSAQHAALESVAARMNQVTSELQEMIMRTRLQPIGTIFGRFPRVVRDLSNTLRKQCQLTIEGQEVELDKSIIEAIGDPLTHLIRNAVDHGIEPPEARLKAGKAAAGSLALRAFHQAGKVNILISDDGRGIDAARLKEKAVAKGFLTPEQAHALSDREVLQLIFRPGFSMAERVTEVSGRGVGMDVVKTNIERLGGTVSIDTQPGNGTTMHVKLPLTLAIIPSLVVRCRDRRYAIPQTSIRELVRIKASEAGKRLERVKEAEVFRLRGTLLPLVRLSSVLNLETNADDAAAEKAVHIIVVETAHLRYGLIVDGLCDSEEIVVKPLGRHMKGCTCLAGATVLGDGKVAMILDIAGIASYSQLTAGQEEAAGENAAADGVQETQPLLLFRNDPTEYFGVPMELVARLERVRTDQIDSVGGQQVLQYRGCTLPLLSLEHHVACKPRPEKAHIYVVVFMAGDREIGLLVPEILDIRPVPTTVDTVTFREPGIAGSLVFERMTLRLVDLHELTCKAHPEWCESQPAQAALDGSLPRVLVAEDSDFFRKQLCGFLESEGYEVQGCEDGLVAWNTLCDPENRFDLVVTDIEMPNLNGLELAQRIRDNPATESLPIIAVTSLAGEDDVRRGQEVGVNEYHVKLDREQLMAAVTRLLKASRRNSPARSPS